MTKISTDNLVKSVLEDSCELRFRWHKGLDILCQYFELTFPKNTQVVGWRNNKLYFRILKTKAKLFTEELYPTIESLEKKYPIPVFTFVYNPQNQDLISLTAMRNAPENPVIIIIEYATPLEDRVIFEHLPDTPMGLNTFRNELIKAYSRWVPDIKTYPFKTHRDMLQLKSWPSRYEQPVDLQLIIEKCTEVK